MHSRTKEPVKQCWRRALQYVPNRLATQFELSLHYRCSTDRYGMRLGDPMPLACGDSHRRGS